MKENTWTSRILSTDECRLISLIYLFAVSLLTGFGEETKPHKYSNSNNTNACQDKAAVGNARGDADQAGDHEDG